MKRRDAIGPFDQTQKMKSPHWRDYPFHLNKRVSNRGVTQGDISRKRTKKALEILTEAEELGEILTEVWEK